MSVEILLIEDNSGDVQIFKEIVSHSSVAVRITVAEDGEKALALLADPLFKPDLIITDISLPKTSGADVLQRCKAYGIPVVVFSASKNPSDRATALELGAKEFVEKPDGLDGYTDAVWKMIWKWVQPKA
jgi:CheY-like chemotaxis protein